MKKYLLFLVIFAIGFLVSCSKNDDDDKNTPPEPTRKELISKTWKILEAYQNGQSVSDPVIFSQRWTFNTNGTYQVVQSSGNLNGVWEFNSDESKIIFNKGAQGEETADILELTATKWKVKSQSGTNNMEIIFIPS